MDNTYAELIPAYLSGELSPVEIKGFEARMAGDSSLRTEVESIRRFFTKLKSMPEVEPRPGLADDIVKAVREQHSDPSPVIRFGWLLAAAASILLAFGIMLQQPTDTSAKPAQAALNWLRDHQQTDGSWNLDGEGVLASHQVGLPALALLALSEQDDQTVTRKAGAYLIGRQNEKGLIGGGDSTPMYDHGIATFALLRVTAGSPDRLFRAEAERAVRFIAQSQTAGGGWGYSGERFEQPNLGVTAWQILALHEASKQNISGAAETLERGLAYVQSLVDTDGTVHYDRASATPFELTIRETTSPTVTAMGAYGLMLAKDATVREKGSAVFRKAMQRIQASDIAGDPYFAFFLANAANRSSDTPERKRVQTMIASLFSSTPEQIVPAALNGNLPWKQFSQSVYGHSMVALTLNVSDDI